jgi:uncharacterized protein DUF6600
MKRAILAVAIWALVFPVLREAEAGTDISVDFFYDNLGDGGNWIEAGDYGYCWQPTVAVSNKGWRPYSDGYWAYTDVGWTWVSYEDFGWATYHYGRWVRLRGRGWVWAPGREWGPAWVSWRSGGDYVGWAPLPPKRGGDIYVDFSGITAQVDIDYDIGPSYYNFIDVRYIGEPVLRERIFAADQNANYIATTVNVTNITYTNSQVYNYGPDYNTLSRYSARPIQRLSLQREANVDPATAVRSKSLMKVQGDKLLVAAPQQFQRPPKPVSPKVVKEKIAKVDVERGWEGGDPKAQAELKEKMRKEDPKVVPPPTVQATEKAETSPAAAAPATTTASEAPGTTTASATPATNSVPSAAASVTPATEPSVSASPRKDNNKNKRNDKVAPPISPSASVPAVDPPAATPVPTREKGKNKQRDNLTPSASVPPATGATETAPAVPPKGPKEKPDRRRVEPSAMPPAPQSAPRVAPPITPEMKNRSIPDSTKPEAAEERPKREAPAEIPQPRKDRSFERVAPVPPASNAPANPAPGRDDGKKKKKDEPAAAPTP